MNAHSFSARAAGAALALAAVCAAGISVEAQRFGRGVTLNGGNSLLYIGTYEGDIQIFDEATEKLIGDIKLKTGIPRSLILSFNKQKFYVLDSTLEKIEIVDIASRAYARHLYAQHRRDPHPHPQHAGRSARALPDPADAERHEEIRSLGDQRRRAAALRPAREEDHPRHSLARR